MGKAKLVNLGILLILFMAFAVPFVSAIPGIPHQFYGSVTVNGQSAPDNNIITAFVQGDTYITVTTNGKYGYSPNIFYVEDSDGDRNGELIQFFVGGKKAGSYVFENNGYTKLDFSLTTTCGDGYCLGDETCSSCQNDCGICTNPPVITIISPEQDKVYDTTKIDLKVSADQGILVWLYALDDADPITFTPNITLTLSEGNHKVEVIGLSKLNHLSGSKTVSFSIDLPEPAPPNPPSGGGVSSGGSSSSGSSGSSGGGSSTTSTGSKTTGAATTPTNTQSTTGANETQPEINPADEDKGLFSGITGAVAGVIGSPAGIGVLIFIIAIVAIYIYTFIMRKKAAK